MDTSDVALPPAQRPPTPPRGLRTLVLATAIGFVVGVFSGSSELAVACAALALEAVRELRDGSSPH